MGETELDFKPQVTAPRPRLRLGFVVALLVAIAAGVVVLLVRQPRAADHAGMPPLFKIDGCTPLQVELAIRDRPDREKAVCLAIAGKIDRARSILLAMPSEERSQTVQTLFEVAHPIADDGDDRSAGPIMELVIELWPENYMAMFHAGMAEAALGQDELASAHLDQFLDMYEPQDVWHDRAVNALAEIRNHAPLTSRHAHFRE